MKKRAFFLVILGITAGFFLKDNAFGPARRAASPDVHNRQLIASSSIEFARVTRVIDGDTIELQGGEHVRYIGMDAPETVDPEKPVQCFGPEASRRNKELIKGKIVRLEKDVSQRDRYGRLLRFVYLPGTTSSIDLELVKEGYARAFADPPDIRYESDFISAEKDAREARRGLWGACPL